VKFAGKTEIYETPETRKTETAVSESNKITAAENVETKTTEIRTVAKNEKVARETFLAD